MKLRLPYQTYKQRSKAITGNRLVNMYAEENPPESKYPYTLYHTPGFKEFADLGTAKGIQGMQIMGGLLYAVSGNEVFKVTTAGTPTSLGSITGTEDRVDLANDGTNMTIINPDGLGWYTTSSTLTAISDGDFPTASSVTFLDGYHIVSKTSSGRFYISSTYDPSSWDALDFATAEETPDNLVRVFSFNSALWLFGTTSYEVYYNSGNADFPFNQIQGAVNTTRGLAARSAIAQEDNSLIFLGDDRIVYRVEGYNPVRLSTYAVESALQGYTVISDAFGFIYTQDGHKFFVLSFPTESATWVCDLSNGLWHERDYQPTEGMWRANAKEDFAGKVLIGHATNGKIYELDYDTHTEDGTVIQRIVEGSVVFDDEGRITHHKVRLDCDAGVGLASGTGADPQVIMTYSDNGGKSYSNERWASFGKIGEYTKRAIWRRNGQSRERTYKFEMTDPVPWRVTGAYVDARIDRT